MPSRIIKVYDGPFPSVEDMMFGDPDTRHPIPNEGWAEQMDEGEIAVFCVNFKSGTPVREADGRPGPPTDEVCRVSNDMAELERHAQEIVRLHPSVVCVFRTKSDREIKRISNRRFLWRFALTSYLGIGMWLVAVTAFGSSIWVLRALIIRSESTFSLKQWIALLAGGAVIGVSSVVSWTWFSVLRRTRQFATGLRKALTPEEKQRYDKIDSLSVSTDPEDRRTARELLKEYQQRLEQIRRETSKGGT